jgi:hypothetical protein
MGGSGDGDRLGADQLVRLADRARLELREADRPPRRNVFISFAHEDEDYVNLLRGQAANESVDLEFNDWSVKEPFDSKNAEYIRRQVRERLRHCSVTLVYLSENAASSQWVDWEIRESLQLGHEVICVYEGRMPNRVPPAVTESRLPCVPWRHDLLMDQMGR